MKTLLSKLCFVWNNQTLWPNMDIHHADCHLVSGVYPTSLYRFSRDPNIYYCSEYNEIFQHILKYLRCSVSLEVSPYSFSGSKVGNNWTGILSLIQQNKADFLPYLFVFGFNRTEIIQNEFMMLTENTICIISRPKMDSSNSSLRKLVKCFSWQIWAMIFVAFVLFAVASIWDHKQCKDRHWNVKNLTEQCSRHYLGMFAILLGQGNIATLKSACLIRPSLYLWVFGAFIIRQLYSADITAALLSNPSMLIDHFDQLREMGDKLQIMVENNSISHLAFVMKYPEFRSYLVPIKYGQWLYPSTINRLDNNVVFVTSRGYGKFIKETFVEIPIHISSEGYFLSTFNFPLRKTLNRTIKSRFDKILKWIYYTGQTKVDYRAKVLRDFQQLYIANRNQSIQQLVQNVQNGLVKSDPSGLNRIVHSTINRQSQIGVLLDVFLYGNSLAVLCLLVEIGIFFGLGKTLGQVDSQLGPQQQRQGKRRKQRKRRKRLMDIDW